jgi:hypothetical protein
MLAVLLLPAFMSRQATQTVELENGKSVVSEGGAGKPANGYLYWSCVDTYLDLTQPAQNFGDSAVLEGGPGHTILIKFGDLERLGQRKRVVKATLYLTASEGGKASLTAVRKVLAPWGEGPLRRPFFTEKSDIAAQWSATWLNRRADPDGIKWQQSGAIGPSDSVPISTAKAEATPTGIAITGIEDAIQSQLDSWYDDNGFALTFSSPIEFFSSKNNGGRPRLVLELADRTPGISKEPDLSVTLIESKYADPVTPENPWPKDGTPVAYVAHIQNVGAAPAQGFSGAWSIKEKLGSSFDVPATLAPGEETTVEIKRTYKNNSDDHRLQPLGFKITPKGPDANPGNNYLEIQENAIPIVEGVGSEGPDWQQRQMRVLNDVLLAQSRFSFAPEGSLERFRIGSWSKDGSSRSLKDVVGSWSNVSYESEQPKVVKIEGQTMARNAQDRWPGLLGGGFTANEISVPGEIQLPYEPYYDAVFDNFELQPTGLLGSTEVASLDANMGVPQDQRKALKLPPTVLLRVLNLDGDPLGNASLSLYQTQNGEIGAGPPALTLTTGDNGTVILPTRPASQGGKGDQFGGLQADGSNGVYLVACTYNGVTDCRWLKAWQLSDAYARTNKAALFTELRFNVPIDAIDTTTNLAAAAKITDSENDANLAGLTDGNQTVNVTLPNKKDAWIELDLGKDQVVTEVDLIGSDPHFWQKFDILAYFTGQKPQDARPYGHEVDWSWNFYARPDLLPGNIVSMPYRGAGKGVRYLRFVCKEPGESAAIAEIKVFGAKGT